MQDFSSCSKGAFKTHFQSTGAANLFYGFAKPINLESIIASWPESTVDADVADIDFSIFIACLGRFRNRF